MASVSEQIASRINLGSITKAEDLKKENIFYSFSTHSLQDRFLHSIAWHRSHSIRKGV